MAGWFYAPPPQPQQLPPSVAPEEPATGIGFVSTGPVVQNNTVVRSLWSQESWSAQTGATVAAQLAIAQTTQSAPVYINNALRISRHNWSPEAWNTQTLTGGGVGALTASVVLIPQPPYIAAANNAAIRETWPEPQWDPQAESTLASIFAVPANQQQIPAQPTSLQQAGIAANWPQPTWPAQGEAAIAGGLAPIQPPAQSVPTQSSIAIFVAGGLWPRESWAAQTAPQSTAWLPSPIVAIPEPVPHPEIRLWPQEQWSAQSSAVVASQLASITQQIPPPPVGILATLRTAWPSEQWPAQAGANIAGMLAPVKPPTFVNNQPLSVLLLAQIVSLWPQPAWGAQSGNIVASQLAQPVVVIQVPTPAQQVVQYLWPKDEWRAQGEIGVAGGLAQQQQPPIFNPNSTVGRQLALVGTWPRDDWAAQAAPPRAAWIPQLVTAVPAPPEHVELLSWPQEAWAAQKGATVAAQLANAVAIVPAPSPQLAAIALWKSDAWSAQSSATIASSLASAYDIPYIFTPARTTEVLSWPQEIWPAQSAATIASQLVATVAIVPVGPIANGTIRALWPQESWPAQTGARIAGFGANTPAPLPFVSIPLRTQLAFSWPRETWDAQRAPQLAYIGANVGPPPPLPPPTGKPSTPANLGYKVTTRTFNLLEMVSHEWGGEFRQPDHRIYEFSNGRGFDSTDMYNTGIYRKK